MTVQTSAIHPTIVALVAACQAASGLAGVSVVDGPRVAADSDKDRLFIGYDPDSDTAVDGTSEVVGSPGKSQNEDFEITCLAEAWTGDTDIAARRARAFAIVAVVETLLRPTAGNYTLGISNLLWALTTGTRRVKQQQTTGGAMVGVVFTVTCRARLGVI